MAELLPGHNVPAFWPFQSLVLNINAITKAHRDEKDCQLCLVIPIGDFVGGELCLLEMGLVLDVKPGDIVIFPSSEVTHFNLHFQGLFIVSILCIKCPTLMAFTKRLQGFSNPPDRQGNGLLGGRQERMGTQQVFLSVGH